MGLKYEDIKIGDELTPYKRTWKQEWVNTMMEMVGSVPNWHTDPEQAKQVSVWEAREESTVLPGVCTEMATCEFIIKWLGDDPKPFFFGGGIEIRLTAPVYVHIEKGGEVTYTGKVVEKDDNEKKILCEVSAQQDERTVMQGKAWLKF